jgi:hypothetical protein
MKKIIHKLTVAFSSGCFGGLVNSFAVWFLGATGITASFNVKIAPSLTVAYLYPRIVWGGIWGILFLLPFFRHSMILRGIVYSLAPTLAQLFIVFPIKLNQGVMGLDLGVLTPLFVLFFNAVWGISAAWWLKLAEKEP